MATKYCSANGCGFANTYSVTPPTKCAKCNTSFAAAFKVAVAAEEEDEMTVVRKIKAKPTTSKFAKPIAKFLQQRRQDQVDASREEEDDEQETEASVPNEVFYDSSEAASTDELIASLNPDDFLVRDQEERSIKLGDLIPRPPKQ